MVGPNERVVFGVVWRPALRLPHLKTHGPTKSSSNSTMETTTVTVRCFGGNESILVRDTSHALKK
jgi:hypothetical protein